MRTTGTVKWYNPEEGYGFIRPDNSTADAFVHHSAVHGQGMKTLNAGDTVAFDLVHGEKGPAAENVARAL